VTSIARGVVRGVAPKRIDLSEKVLFGDVWERPGLSKRDRSFITVAALARRIFDARKP
jgi:4-carboxymuconolactone decarboxylase